MHFSGSIGRGKDDGVGWPLAFGPWLLVVGFREIVGIKIARFFPKGINVRFIFGWIIARFHGYIVA